MSDLPANVATFNVIVGHVFAQTYAKFPMPVVIDEIAIANAMGVEIRKLWTIVGKRDRVGYLPDGDHLEHFLHSTLKWLRDEKFIRAEGDYNLYNCVLTKEALAIMNKVPKGVKENKTLGAQLSEAVKGAGKAAGDALIGDLVGQVIGGFAKSFGS